MFYIISKLLKFIVMPLSWVIGLLIAATFVKDKGWRRLLFGTAVVLMIVFTDKPLLQLAQYHYTKGSSCILPPKAHYDIAIIMGGFGSMNTSVGQFIPFQDRSPRLMETLRLHNMGIVDKILISGDETIAIDNKGNTTAPAFLRYMEQMGVPDSCWILEQKARNSRENATYSIAILDSLGYRPQQCLLVSSASHLRRSLDCFTALGWNMDTYATNIYPYPGHQHFRDFVPSWRILIDWQELLNEYFGNIVYRIVGYK